ncbi:MAG: 4-amino-4-deoxychorismate lyase [Cyanothece sp. SIO1E1]|nr:4-amino-4-deoxychorismate lyase [Cyanothece sp. SIO1E1]
MKSWFWYDGDLIQSGKIALSIEEPGLLYGATVFTTLRVYRQSLDHTLTNWVGHCDRLHHTLTQLGWQHPDWSRVRQGAEALTEHFPVLRITLFPDGREWITGRALPTDLPTRQQHGVMAWLAELAPSQSLQRSLSGHKTGNYLVPWLALQKAQQQGAKEAIFIDTQGTWLETSTGNLWGWQDDCWWTPPLTAGILPGLGRSQLVNWLKSQDQPLQQLPWTSEIGMGFEAIAYTNSVVEIVPIHTVLQSGKKIRYDPNHNSFNLLKQFFEQLR